MVKYLYFKSSLINVDGDDYPVHSNIQLIDNTIPHLFSRTIKGRPTIKYSQPEVVVQLSWTTYNVGVNLLGK